MEPPSCTTLSGIGGATVVVGLAVGTFGYVSPQSATSTYTIYAGGGILVAGIIMFAVGQADKSGRGCRQD